MKVISKTFYQSSAKGPWCYVFFFVYESWQNVCLKLIRLHSANFQEMDQDYNYLTYDG